MIDEDEDESRNDIKLLFLNFQIYTEIFRQAQRPI